MTIFTVGHIWKGNKMEDQNLLSEEHAIQETDSWLTQKTFNEVAEEIYQRGSFTVCILHAFAEGRQFEGAGFSKARPEVSLSKYDPERGKKVARGRAIHDLFGEFKRQKKK